MKFRTFLLQRAHIFTTPERITQTRMSIDKFLLESMLLNVQNDVIAISDIKTIIYYTERYKL